MRWFANSVTGRSFWVLVALGSSLGFEARAQDSRHADASRWSRVGKCRTAALNSHLGRSSFLSGVEIQRSSKDPEDFRLHFGFLVPVSSRIVPVSGRSRVLAASLGYMLHDSPESPEVLTGPDLLEFRSLDPSVTLNAAFGISTTRGLIRPGEGHVDFGSRDPDVFSAAFVVRPGTAIFHDLLSAGGIDSSGSGTVTCQGSAN